MKQAIDNLREAADKNTAAMAAGTPVVLANAGATAAASQAMSSVGPAGSTAAAGTGMAAGGMIALAAAIAGALVLLGPFILALVGAVVIMTAFVVGMTAVALSLALVGGLLGGVVAGMIMLADRLYTTGQIANDPLFGLHAALTKMADAWGRQALPMALQMISWLTSLMPLIQQVGSSILDWFGPRMASILSIAQIAFTDIYIAVKQLGDILGPLIDKMIASTPQWTSFFNTLLGLGVQAVGGLLTNLIALSGWFMERWPRMKPIVEEILSVIGTFVQGAAKKFGELVDWFIQHWPEIETSIKKVWKAWQEGWDIAKPGIDEMIVFLGILNPLLVQSTGGADGLAGAWRILGFVAGIMAAIVIGLVVVFELVGVALSKMGGVVEAVTRAGAAAFGFFGMATITVLRTAGNMFDAFGTTVHGVWGTVSPLLSALASGFETGFGRAARAIQPLLDALGRVAGAVSAALQALHLLPGSGGGITVGSERGIGSYQSGGIVSGPVGAPQLAIVHGGEKVIPVGGGGAGMDDTNEILALIYQILSARLQPVGFNTVAYARP